MARERYEPHIEAEIAKAKPWPDLLSIRESIAGRIELRTPVDELVKLVADNIDVASQRYPTASRFCFLERLGTMLQQMADDHRQQTFGADSDDYRGD